MTARKRNLLTVGAVAAVLLLIIGIGYAVQSGRDTTGEDSADPRGVNADFGVVIGEADAPTTITVYEDFQCPICGQFEELTADQLRDAVEAGDVKVEYRIVSFLDRFSENAYSSRAANAALAVLDTAGPDAFWTFHDELFADQPAEGTAGPTNDELIDKAVKAGADRDEVADAIEDGAFDQHVVNATDAMSKNGVNGTPTVLVDGKVAGPDPVQAVLDAVS